MTRLVLSGTCSLLLAFLIGCGSNPAQDQATVAQNQERERLQAENQDLATVAAENEEVQRLRKENQELPKLRSQYQEAARLKKDNELLKQQIAKISPAAATNNPSPALVALAAQVGANPQIPGVPDKNVATDESTLNEGDEVVIDPKYLKQLLPDLDLDKLGRKEPIGVRNLLEKDGVQITNVQQLREFGLTNYTIRRAQPTAPALPPAAPQQP